MKISKNPDKILVKQKNLPSKQYFVLEHGDINDALVFNTCNELIEKKHTLNDIYKIIGRLNTYELAHLNNCIAIDKIQDWLLLCKNDRKEKSKKTFQILEKPLETLMNELRVKQVLDQLNLKKHTAASIYELLCQLNSLELEELNKIMQIKRVEQFLSFTEYSKQYIEEEDIIEPLKEL